MPGWWYTIESTTTNHLLTQFESACREALSSDRSTRELMRAKSAKQRFPVVEWIRKLDKLQVRAVKLSRRAKKRADRSVKSQANLRNSMPISPPTSTRITANPNTSTLSLPLADAQPPFPPARYHLRESYASSIVSDDEEAHDKVSAGTRTPTEVSITTDSEASQDLTDDAAPTSSTIVGPLPEGSGQAKTLSLGTRIGPGHARHLRRESGQTLGSLSAVDEEQHHISVADEDDEYLYTPASIRRTIARNVKVAERRYGLSRRNESSDDESDATDTDREYESDPEQSTLFGLQTQSPFFHDTLHGEYDSLQEIPPRAPTPLNMMLRTPSASPSPPGTLDRQRINGSHLSLASVLSGRSDFALSKVEDLFTDADGKYFKQFSSELSKMDAKTSKDELCIEEFIFRSEKEWATSVRSKKLGLDTAFGSDMKGYFSKQTPAQSSDGSDDGQLTRTHTESHVEKPLFGYTPPTGLKLFLQRRIGDWPLYSFLLALVCPICCVKSRVKSLPPVRFSSPSSLIKPHKARRSYTSSLRSTWSRR
jgi:alpha-1,3-glucan synthase